MEQLNGSAQNRETMEIGFIKDEFIDDFYFNDSFELKEEVASICDEEQGYDSDDIKNEELLSLGPAANLEHLFQDRNIAELKKNRRRRKHSKLKEKQKEVKEIVSKTGRISRDEIFKNKEYFCSLCQKLIVGRKCFKQHFKSHITKNQNRYTCFLCNYTSKFISHINRHVLETHCLHREQDELEKLFACRLCERRFHARKDLERHEFVHSGEGNLKCGECDFSCTKKTSLESHMFSFHKYPKLLAIKSRRNDDELELKCYYCNYSSKCKVKLRNHIKRHVGLKMYKCPECSYECSMSGDLQKHITIHSDSRPFVCNDCKRTFKRRAHLLSHFKGKSSCSIAIRKNKKSKV